VVNKTQEDILFSYCITKQNQRDIHMVQHGKVGHNAVKYTMAFLYSDWLCVMEWYDLSSSNKGNFHSAVQVKLYLPEE